MTLHAQMDLAGRPGVLAEVGGPALAAADSTATDSAWLPIGQSAAAPLALQNKRRQRVIVRVLALASDLLAIATAFLIANVTWFNDPFHVHALNLLKVILPIYVVAAANSGAYSVHSALSPALGVLRAWLSFVFTLCTIGLIIFFLRMGTDFSRAIFIIGSGGALVGLAAFRLLLRKPASSILNGRIRSTLVIVDGIDYEAVDEDEVIVTPEQLHFDPATSDPLRFHRLAQSVGELDRIIVGCPKERHAQWSSVLKGLAVDGHIFTDEDDPVGIIGIGAHGPYRTLVVAAGPLHLRQRVLKRAMDFVLSAGALVVLAPFLLAVAFAIKLEDKGPALFRQNRIGRHNRLFKLYKFRSMYADQCDADAAQLTARTDPRVTRVGEFIRRTSIDELPQLINVLKGEMSLVGPRPHAISAKAADLLYWDVDPRYRHRHSIKPGLTGLAQVRGFRGATDRTEDLVNRLTSDLEYAANWSLAGDLRIIFRTLKVLRHDNAF